MSGAGTGGGAGMGAAGGFRYQGDPGLSDGELIAFASASEIGGWVEWIDVTAGAYAAAYTIDGEELNLAAAEKWRVMVTRGSVDLEIRIAPRFDYGAVRPWIRRHGHRLFSAIGGDDGLIVWCDEELEENPDHELFARLTVAAGDRRRLSMRYCPPALIDAEGGPEEPDPAALDRELEEISH